MGASPPRPKYGSGHSAKAIFMERALRQLPVLEVGALGDAALGDLLEGSGHVARELLLGARTRALDELLRALEGHHAEEESVQDLFLGDEDGIAGHVSSTRAVGAGKTGRPGAAEGE